MSLGRCLVDLVASKTITPERAAAMQPIYDELVAQYEPKFGRAAAESMATDKAMAAIEADFTHGSLNKVREARIRAGIVDNATRLYRRPGEPGKPSAAGLIAHLVDDGHAPYANVEYRWKSLRDEAHRMMYDLLWKHRANVIGEARHLSDFTDVVRELGGQATESLNAREFADSWGKTAEFLRTAYNAAGGRIAKLEGWMLPHHWDGVKVGLRSSDEFIADIAGALDRSKMIDRNTGEPMSDFALEAMLRDTYETIVSEGTAGKEASAVIGGKSFANRRQDHRVLHFAKPDDWMALNEKYGAGDPYGAMMHHIDSMSRDIAAMQILGPNPAATVRWMQDLIGKTALNSPRLAARFGVLNGQRQVEKIWDQITGASNIAAKPNTALFFSTLRNWQSASKLGSAAIASVPDMATQALTTRFNGLPVSDAIKAMAGAFNPLDARDRDFARRALMIQEEMIGRMPGYGRAHFEDVQGGALTAPTFQALRDGRIGKGDFAYLSLNQALQKANEVSRRASNLTMRASLLNQWTLQMRHATNMEFWNGITHFADTPFAELNSGFRGFLERYGVNADEWARIGATPRTEYRGTQWVLPDAIEDKALRQKLVEGVLTELDYAVATGGIRQRAAMTVGRPGEVSHELVKSFGQFLMFPITVTSRHASRAWSLSTVGTRAGYATAFAITTMVMGAVAEQLSQLSRGRDPRPMDDPAFWGKAFSRGGALGYYGDIIQHSLSPDGKGLTDLLNVPSAGGLADVANVARQPFMGTNKQGQPRANYLRAGAKILRQDVPLSNLWWTRLAYERLLLDNLDEMAGNHPGEAAKRMEKRAADEGTRYFAPPGTGPDQWRAPDLANALGNDQALPSQ